MKNSIYVLNHYLYCSLFYFYHKGTLNYFALFVYWLRGLKKTKCSNCSNMYHNYTPFQLAYCNKCQEEWLDKHRCLVIPDTRKYYN